MMRTKKRAWVLTADGTLQPVSIAPGLTLAQLRQLLRLPPNVDVASDGAGRVLLPNDDLFAVLCDEDILRIEPAAYLGSPWFDLFVIFCVGAFTLPRFIRCYRALRSNRRVETFEARAPMCPTPPSPTAIMLREDEIA